MSGAIFQEHLANFVLIPFILLETFSSWSYFYEVSKAK
jgi:hypothetical protein